MEKKYLIYKVSGGLCHMLGQIHRAIHTSKITNRILIIDCYNGWSFRNDFNKYFNIPNYNYTTNYDVLYQDSSLDPKTFEPYASVAVSSFGTNDYFVNDKLVTIDANAILNNNDKIIWCSWINPQPMFHVIPWQIKVNKNIIDQIIARPINENYIGVHYRNTDMIHNLNDFIPKIEKILAICNTIYLATDDFNALNNINNLLHGNFKILQYTKPFNASGRNIHYHNPNKDDVIFNALMDMYYLTYATHFIPSISSSFSQLVLVLRKNDVLFK